MDGSRLPPLRALPPRSGKTAKCSVAMVRCCPRETDIQSWLQSLLGLLMATSGCPHMRVFAMEYGFELGIIRDFFA
ncbi:MAG: hypothetical protein NT080_00805 [Spirochaetes bacterium]|nr:hypothetical protein [Spirochaetota bacterium]